MQNSIFLVPAVPGFLLCIKEDIPPKPLVTDFEEEVEAIFVELNLSERGMVIRLLINT